MVRSNTEALAEAKKSTTNVPGTCQLWTRTKFDAPSAGDQDGDKDADANDGWASEPKSARVLGDRNPPPGAPLYFKNADGTGFGHRCISTGVKSGARSTDMSNGRYSPGKVGNTTIEGLEKAMGLTYVGWSRTITGIPIPGLEKKVPPKKPAKKTPAKPKPDTSKKIKANEVRMIGCEVALQFSDSVAQRRRDANAIFKEADEKNYWYILGTEALERETRQALNLAAKKYGWYVYIGNGTDTWAAVNLKYAKAGTLMGWTGPVVVKGQAKKHAAKKTVRLTFFNEDIGWMNLYPVHNLAGSDVENQKKHMAAIGKDAKKEAAGLRLALMGGDGNVQDKKFDPTYDNGFVTCWDDLKKYPNTGHGCIDFIARWKADTRVRVVNAVVKGDKDFPLSTDHFMVVAVHAVQKLKK